MSDLQFSATKTAGEVHVSGDLNRNSVPRAWSDREDWKPANTDVVLDLADVGHVDSAGLALLIRLKSELEAAGQSLSLRNVNKQLQQFAAVSGVTGLLSLS